jgi:isoleucyl-tRNA synthetase
MTEKSYNINSPQTDFPMKANSATREVEIQADWETGKVYERSLEKRKSAEKFVLHDGPPYASSPKIHIGTAMNKILKDIITKYKSMRGYYSPYVPGYDCHGLPIEHAVLKEVKGGHHALGPLEVRKRSREFALTNLAGQTIAFKRLGVWGEWERYYATLHKEFESAQIRVFGKMAKAGYIYKGLKSIQWCPTCETALAEAEVEYAEHVSDAVYVKFALDSDSTPKLPDFVPKGAKVYFVIWTTTPWTLPANLGIALNPDFDYDFVQLKSKEIWIVAQRLKEAFFAEAGIEAADTKVLGTVLGKKLELLKARHPFVDRESLVVLGGHVTAETGTGCVHTAPGHGAEDFEVGMRYKLPILSPVDGKGIFTKEANQFAGIRYDKANEAIVELLREKGVLVKHSKYRHSYPHCWRCKKPLIFRATEQWFASVDGFRKQALSTIDKVEWLPASGRNRIYSMVENRSDWCISRQRSWGVPIPIFYCKSCQKPLVSAESIEQVASVFEKEGSDAWWEREAEFFLGSAFKCESCGKQEFTKEMDTMDVWFDSGTTYAGVLDQRPELKGTPCEMYLEGSDQHRGWFQSSLLTSVATKGQAPYKIVLTHGFVVDENGRKMSKSVGNVVDPQDVIKQYGADVLRLWVASVNYTDDVPIGKGMLAQLAEVYRKLRNTARYLLSNLCDFDPEHDIVPFDQLKDLDKFILHRLNEVVEDVTADFDRYEFFKYYQVLQNFCVVDLSSFYFDIAKDTLYTAAPKSIKRRSIQTVFAQLLHVLTRLLVPVAPHLAEDIWKFVPSALKRSWKAEDSVLLSDFPQPHREYLDEARAEYWRDLIKVRSTVNKVLEQARAAGKIRSPLEAQVILSVEDERLSDELRRLGDELAPFFITSQAKVKQNENHNHHAGPAALAELSENGISLAVLPADGEKCVRCWKYSTFVGKDKTHPELCNYCVAALSEK